MEAVTFASHSPASTDFGRLDMLPVAIEHSHTGLNRGPSAHGDIPNSCDEQIYDMMKRSLEFCMLRECNIDYR